MSGNKLASVKEKKPSAADRTVSLFQEPQIEAPQDEEKSERQTLEESTAEGQERAGAFLGQSWATKFFGIPEPHGNQYRVSFKDHHYYLEKLSKLPGMALAHGYTGLMVHENDLLPMVTVLVQAVRDKQAKEAK